MSSFRPTHNIATSNVNILNSSQIQNEITPPTSSQKGSQSRISKAKDARLRKTKKMKQSKKAKIQIDNDWWTGYKNDPNREEFSKSDVFQRNFH